ncbi:hypothetical protein 2 [Hubei tombus-like virus 10]|uniref:hypothetical protein 2 n=1 Tax=Hubei tombus-like virus 10 TaxID=1923256 RepID=UPI00090B3B06|nr:hypothetical protein 2 [Hubei tombus-like virus 10]APG76527.1 hypothetical protein 2 [Hubei tombus-like virus 10]
MRKPSNLKSANAWAKSLSNPFGAPAAHIPDFETNSSGMITSTLYTQVLPLGYASTATTHNVGMIIQPHPRVHFTQLSEVNTGTANMTDMNSGNTDVGALLSVPNLAGFGDQVRYRMTSCGVRVTYAGTELNRSGEYIAGFLQTDYPAQGTTAAATGIGPMSTLMPKTTLGYWTMAQIIGSLKNPIEARICDGTAEFHWKPNGVPGYGSGGANIAYFPTTSGTAGAVTNPSGYASNPGEGGVPYGSENLVILIRGDTTAAAATTGNVYDVTVTSHWEVIPSVLNAVVYDVSPSLSDPQALSAAMNVISRRPNPLFSTHGVQETTFEEPVYNVKKNKVKQIAQAAQESGLVQELGMRALRVAAGIATRKLAGRTRAPVPPGRRLEF